MSKPLLVRKQIPAFLEANGRPISLSYLNRLCLPSRNAGPPVETWFGRKPLYAPEQVLQWAQARCSNAPGKLA